MSILVLRGAVMAFIPDHFEIILMGKRELFALLCLSSWCLVIVVWLFLTIPRVCLQFVIVVLPDHTHYFLLLGKSTHQLKSDSCLLWILIL